ncbi:MAG: hypothetical protein K2F99_05600 [Muribaculaceae bacterium]|nr:hypothetical protein [Muribaculaceae bacterium]
MTKELSERVTKDPEYTGVMDPEDLAQEICADALDYIRSYTITTENYDEFREMVWRQLQATLQSEKYQKFCVPFSSTEILAITSSPEELILRYLSGEY